MIISEFLLKYYEKEKLLTPAKKAVKFKPGKS